MKRTTFLFCLLAAQAASVGCGQPNIEEEAKKLVVPMAIPSMVMAVMTGTGEQLVERGEIDLHRRIEASDGVEIDVWAIRNRADAADATGNPSPDGPEETRGTVVLLPPLLTCKSWFLELGKKLSTRGWDVVLIDHRAHGWSAGKYVTWGAKEKHDVKAVMDSLIAEDALCENIFVVGASMGAAVAIQYAAIEPRCKGVLALAPPAGARQIARRILLMLSKKDFEATLKQAAQMADFDPAEADTVAAASKLKCPILLVHGLCDWVVPYQHSQAIYTAAPEPKKLLPLILHGHAAEVGREEWLAKQVEALAEMQPKTPKDLDAASPAVTK
ncbi:MAG: alpha/beta hydrolase [Planctomycetota bacterium]|jgi:pimeloyl-ACP methyl ester carboxylesterase